MVHVIEGVQSEVQKHKSCAKHETSENQSAFNEYPRKLVPRSAKNTDSHCLITSCHMKEYIRIARENFLRKEANERTIAAVQ